MTDEKTPQEAKDEQTSAPEQEQPSEETQTPDQEDGPPEVAGETPPQQPQQPQQPQDPTLLGALTPQENAVLVTLRRQSSQIMMEIGKIELQKVELLDRVRANDEQSQSILLQIGQRLGIQDGVSWTVGGDGNARLVPPQLAQAMRGGGMPRMAAAPQAAATASQPPAQQQEGEKPKEE